MAGPERGADRAPPWWRRLPRTPGEVGQALAWRTAGWRDRLGSRWRVLEKSVQASGRAVRRRARFHLIGFAEVAGIRIRLGPHLSPHIQEVIDTGEYERSELEVLRATLQADDVVMELGTGIGVVAAYASRAIGSERVFTYEANPALEPHIRDTFALNGVAPGLAMCLLGRGGGTAPFHVHPEFWTSSTIDLGPEARLVTVSTQPLVDELRRVRPTFLVIDIEGGELDLCELLQLDGVRKVLIEVHEWAIGRDGLAAVERTFAGAGLHRDADLSTERVWFLRRA
jgi:FkbM family methyltransferase